MGFIDLSTRDWDDFFPDVVTIHEETQTCNDLGSVVSTWAPLDGHNELGAQVIFKGGQLVNLPDRGAVYSTHEINLRGRYDGIKARMRAIVGNRTFLILSAGADSQSVKTQLRVEEIL